MKKLVRIAAAGVAALLMTAVGAVGAGAATIDDRDRGTDGTRVTSGDVWDWSIGTDGTRVTSDDSWDW